MVKNRGKPIENKKVEGVLTPPRLIDDLSKVMKRQQHQKNV